MPPNPILICARGAELRSQLESTLTQAGYHTVSVGTPADAVATMRATPVDLIVAEGLAASGAISALRTVIDGHVTPILVIAPAGDVEARIAFLEAGADDVVAAGFSRNELESRAMALLIRAGKVRPEQSGSGEGSLIAFFSPKGGVGTTTLAVNTSVLLAGGSAANRGRLSLNASRVLLIDMDLQFGQVATHLNLQPRYDLGILASDDAALAEPDIARSYLSPHASGLYVLPAPARPESDFRVTVEEVQRIVDVMRPFFDQIVIDLGSRLDPRTLWVLEQADAHVLVLFPEIAALRSMSILMGFLGETTTLDAHTHLVINHVFPNELLKTRDVENLLHTKPTAEIPYTDVEMIRSVNEGNPLVTSHPQSPATAAMRRVAQALIGIDEMQADTKKPERRGIFGRR